MKNSNSITILSLQFFTFIITLVITFKILKTQQLVVETRKNLETTIKVMSDIDKQNKQAVTEKTKQEVKMKPVALGEKAPDFSLKDDNNKIVSLKDYRGKKVILVISDPQCENCQNFYPVLNQFSIIDKNTEVLIMMVETTPEQNKLYKKEKNINAKILATPVNDVISYGIQATPTSIVIDENGFIIGNKVCTTLIELTNLVNIKK
ncbi:peroxiredoxin family protein [Flavobacterium sp.]|uniref:peroxiredoxin family protein n=1 Tax=Flavobacterium sp. TaxID=239 RepID=UPI00375093A7